MAFEPGIERLSQVRREFCGTVRGSRYVNQPVRLRTHRTLVTIAARPSGPDLPCT